MDYGHPLEFGAFITPTSADAGVPGRVGAEGRGGRSRPGDLPGSPLPAAVPGHLDAHVIRRSADREHPDRAERAERPAAPACRGRTRCGEPRPAVGRPVRPGSRSRRILGRDRGHGRRAAHPRPGGHRAGRGHRCDPRAVGHRPARRSIHLRRPPSRARSQARAAARARHPDLDRRLQVPDAGSHRPQGRRLAAQPRATPRRATSRGATPRSTRPRFPPGANLRRSGAS